MTLRYVTIKKFAELSGYTEKAVEHKVSNGVWAEGVQYRRAPDNRILVNLEEYHRWVEGVLEPALKRSQQASGSRSVWKDDGKEKLWR